MSRHKKHEHVNHERWLVSYADFITLLFAFFVVLYATSQTDQKKMREAEFSIRAAFQTMGIFPVSSKDPNLGAIAGAAASAVAPPDVSSSGDMDHATEKNMVDLKRMQHKMEMLLAPQITHGTVAVRIGREGLVISLMEAGFFESASATPKPACLATLNSIGSALASTGYSLRIEGHTDDVPIHNDQFASNWELSTARATVLTRMFIEQDHIAPDRLSASGYAEYHPVASNQTEQGRSRNRRVDIIVLPNHPSQS